MFVLALLVLLWYLTRMSRYVRVIRRIISISTAWTTFCASAWLAHILCALTYTWRCHGLSAVIGAICGAQAGWCSERLLSCKEFNKATWLIAGALVLALAITATLTFGPFLYFHGVPA